MAKLTQIIGREDWGFTKYVGILIVVVLFWQAAGWIYNAYFHQLRRFPGPLASRMSRLAWSIRHAKGQQVFHTQRMHDRYGTIVRIGPNHLSITDPTAWKEIYSHGAGTQYGVAEMIKSPRFSRNVKGMPTTIVNAPREEHQLLRRALSHGFSDGSLRGQEPIMTRYVNLLVQRLCQECDDGRKALNMAAWYNWTTFDLASDLIFGESFHCLETVNYHPWVATIMKTIKFHAAMLALGYSGASGAVQMIYKLGGFLAMSNLKEYTNSMLRSRLRMKEGRNDLFEGIARKREEWNMPFAANVHKLHPDKLSSNATVMLLAGSETTATALSGATYLLLSHPEALKKMKHEIRSSFSSAEEITIASVSKLQYTGAVIAETLRMYPPLTSGMVRVVPPGGAELAGQFVPGGTLVEMQHWSVNHSEANWQHPWEFRPERFLRNADEALRHGDKLDAVQAFSIGPRNCIGRNLANAEMRLVLANMFYNFDMELNLDSKNWIERQKNFNVWDRIPLNVQAIPVKATK